jgi:Protein of unknown function (DUF3568)
MIKRMISIVFLFLAASLISGCAVFAVLPLFGASYQGYTVWEGRTSTRYYAWDLDTTYRAVKRSCEQLKLETVIQNPASEHGYSLETKGNHPMQINVLPVETNLTKIVITIALFGDKPYIELFYKTVDDNIPKKKVLNKEKS